MLNPHIRNLGLVFLFHSRILSVSLSQIPKALHACLELNWRLIDGGRGDEKREMLFLCIPSSWLPFLFLSVQYLLSRF